MYIPKYSEVIDKNEIFAFVEANAFGQLISSVDDRPFSTHIPFLVSEGRTKLIDHLAKTNPQWNDIHGQQVLVSLQGPHGYVSPAWCNSVSVPTWNYQAVHVYGECQVFEDTEKLKQVVNTLTDKYEAAFDPPWQPEYNKAILGAIIGVEINISELQCKYKLSQNRPEEDRKEIVKRLKLNGSKLLAESMELNDSR